MEHKPDPTTWGIQIQEDKTVQVGASCQCGQEECWWALCTHIDTAATLDDQSIKGTLINVWNGATPRPVEELKATTAEQCCSVSREAERCIVALRANGKHLGTHMDEFENEWTNWDDPTGKG